jgi:hypothetical protein
VHFHLRGYHPLWPAFPDRSINALSSLFAKSFQPPAIVADNPPLRAFSCGPATPRSPCGSHGLGSSDFARHYFRNHGCFLFLRVLRWFTSPGSLRHPMDSDGDDACSHASGFPIRISPDHSLFTAPRSFSQLTTSFFACLRLGIHTHALSSLTTTSASYTNYTRFTFILVFVMPVNIQLSKISISSSYPRNRKSSSRIYTPGCSLPASRARRDPRRRRLLWWAWVDSNYRPHPYQGCALTT